MFDIGFWEVMLIGVIALLVVGPEKLPALLRTVGGTLGKARRFLNDARAELDKEVNRAEEIKRRIVEETKIAELHAVIDDSQASVPFQAGMGVVSAQNQGLSQADSASTDSARTDSSGQDTEKDDDRPA